MTSTRIPHQIRASIHQDAINRVSEFFNATTSDIMNELLQNCRRAGASRVDITLVENLITVADDGKGISNPEALLSFGLTEWDQQTTNTEHPAGMGLYALARREHISVCSRSDGADAWQVNLTPDHFVGKLPAPIERVPNSPTTGTTVSFTGDRNDETSIRNSVRYFPLPVRINGNPAEQSDFLENALHIEEWQGITIGVYLNSRPSITGRSAELNFHGVIVRDCKLPQIKGIDSRWFTQADVRESPQLELTLPARREVVENPFMDEFRQACRNAVYRAMTLQPEPVDVPKKVQQAATAVGIALPDATPRLMPWRPANAHENHYNSSRHPVAAEQTIVMDVNLSTHEQQCLARAAQKAGIMERLFEPEPDLAGYRWYDNLPKAADVKIAITNQEGEHDMNKVRETEHRLTNQRPDAVNITMTTKTNTVDESNSDEVIHLPTDLAFDNDEFDYMDDIKPLVTRDSDMTADELANLMMRSFFSHNEEYDADSFDTQELNHREAYEKTAVELLQSKDDAIVATISTAINRYVLYELPPGTVATIRVKRHEPIQITLEHGT